MAELRDVIAYILQRYPEDMAGELSNARVTKMVYLSDWRNCLRGKGQISEISWYFDNYGPFVWDVKNTVDQNPDIFASRNLPNKFGSPKVLFKLKNKGYIPDLTDSEKKSKDHVISVSSKKYWNEFIKLVYSTHSIASSERYSSLDLKKKALEYKVLRDA